MCTNLQTRPICLKTRTLHCNLDICKPCPARLCLQTNKLVTVQAAASANNTHLSADKDCRLQILTFHLQTRVDTFADMVCKQNTPICKRSKVSADIVTDSANENSYFAELTTGRLQTMTVNLQTTLRRLQTMTLDLQTTLSRLQTMILNLKTTLSRLQTVTLNLQTTLNTK